MPYQEATGLIWQYFQQQISPLWTWAVTCSFDTYFSAYPSSSFGRFPSCHQKKETRWVWQAKQRGTEYSWNIAKKIPPSRATWFIFNELKKRLVRTPANLRAFPNFLKEKNNKWTWVEWSWGFSASLLDQNSKAPFTPRTITITILASTPTHNNILSIIRLQQLCHLSF